MSNSMKSSTALRVLNSALIVLFCLAIILPFLHVLAISLNSGIDAQKGGIGFWPREWSVENYTEVFKQDNLLNGLFISIFRTVVGTVVGVALMSMAAYAMTIKTLPGRKAITFFVFFTMLFSGGTVPYYLVLTELNLTNTIWVYIIPSLYSVTNILLLRTSFNQLPFSVIEAARIDGCSEFKIFRSIVIPMSKPVLATISLFTAVGHWNDWYAGSFFVRDASLKPLATLLQEMLTRQAALSDILLRNSGSMAYAQLDKMTVTSDSLQMATIIVVMLPMIAIYPFIQKYFVKGITVGSIKE
ncbi:putative aldouronate transport system permease protein [Neobacillus niacini]|uniref:carbohydrate ABC transporter permease n=1 Tax=Neobacillus niacini TaxID=86668 RepID=UPI00286061FB|nr:carbohydrate ABC transporter permease [Neobacillus niacini]MDR7079869.1 putative aldouronate transport system permease protein [Neobacillus niacini]